MAAWHGSDNSGQEYKEGKRAEMRMRRRFEYFFVCCYVQCVCSERSRDMKKIQQQHQGQGCEATLQYTQFFYKQPF